LAHQLPLSNLLRLRYILRIPVVHFLYTVLGNIFLVSVRISNSRTATSGRSRLCRTTTATVCATSHSHGCERTLVGWLFVVVVVVVVVITISVFFLDSCSSSALGC
jgi:hypothetical protein